MSHLRLGLTSVLLPSAYPTKLLYTFLIPTRATWPAHLNHIDLITILLLYMFMGRVMRLTAV